MLVDVEVEADGTALDAPVALGELELLVSALPAPPVPKVTAPVASWMLNGGGGTMADVSEDDEEEVLLVDVDVLAPAEGAVLAALVPVVPLALEVVEVVGAQDGLLTAVVPAAPVELAADGRVDARLLGEALAALEAAAPLALAPVDAAGTLAPGLAPVLEPAAPEPQAASTSEAAASDEMSGLEIMIPPRWSAVGGRNGVPACALGQCWGARTSRAISRRREWGWV